MKRNSTQSMVLCAILTAIVVLLQFMGSFIHLGVFSVSLVLVPIVIGAATCGIGSGAWLGLVFGFTVLLSGDATAFMAVNVPGTIITVLLKGLACGAASAFVYKIFAPRGHYLATTLSAMVCPVVNTGVFLLGCFLFFMNTVAEFAVGAGFGENVGKYIIFGLIGGNFVFEFILNIVISPVIVHILNIRHIQAD